MKQKLRIPIILLIFFLTTVMLVGAIVALFADVVAQMPGSQVVLPLNAVTSLIGAPVIAWFILRKKNMNETFAT